MPVAAPGFEQLRSHAARLSGTSIAGLLKDEPGRVQAQALQVGPLYATFARQRWDAQAWAALLELGRGCDLGGAFRRLFDGDTVNPTEGRAALHTALRGDLSSSPVARQAFATVASEIPRCRASSRVDQCVTPNRFGGGFNVAVMIAA